MGANVALPPGFQLDQPSGAGGGGLPPGFQLDKRPEVDTSEGAGFMDRLKSAFLSKPEEKLGYYKSVYGPENVQTTSDGGIIWKHPGDKKWHPIDEKGLSWADLADFAGDVPSMVGMGVGGAVGAAAGPVGAVGGAAAGGAAGDLVKQGIASMMPGAQSRDVSDRLKEAAGEGAMAGATEATFGLAKALKPTELISKFLAKQASGPETNFAKESMRLQDATGIKMRASQESMNPDIALMEGFAARNPFGKTIFQKADIANQNVAETRLQRLLDQAGGELDKPGLGRSIADSAGVVMSNLMDARKAASDGFKLLDSSLSGKPIFDLSNFRSYLKGEGQRFAADGMSKNAQAYGEALLKEAEQFGGPASARGLQDALQRYGDIAYGKTGSKLFRDIDSSAERRVAGGAFKALQKDLDAAADFGSGVVGKNGEQPLNQGMAKLLKGVRDNYSAATKNIDDFRGTVVAKMLDRDTGQNFTNVAEWLPKQNPEAIRNTMEVLGRANPEIQTDIVRSVLTDALKAGRVDAPVPFDRASALSALPKDLEARNALFGGHLKDGEIQDLFKAIERSTWKPPGQGIPSSPLATLLSAAKSALGGDFQHIGVAVLAPKLIAQWATDPTKRTALKAALMAGNGARQETARKVLVDRLKDQIGPVSTFQSVTGSPSDPRVRQ